MSKRQELTKALQRLVDNLKPFPESHERTFIAASIDQVVDVLAPEPIPEKISPSARLSVISDEMLRQAKRDAWQEGYDHRDIRKPGGTVNNPYHDNYQGIVRTTASESKKVAYVGSVAPESWVEERAALLAENFRLRGEVSTNFRMASAPDGVASQWHDWARTIVGGNPLNLFERTKEEIAALSEVSRINERKAMRALKVLVDYRRLLKERSQLGPFHGSESARVLDLLNRLEYEQLGPGYAS